MFFLPKGPAQTDVVQLQFHLKMCSVGKHPQLKVGQLGSNVLLCCSWSLERLVFPSLLKLNENMHIMTKHKSGLHIIALYTLTGNSMLIP